MPPLYASEFMMMQPNGFQPELEAVNLILVLHKHHMEALVE